MHGDDRGTVYSGAHLASGSPLGNAQPPLDVNLANKKGRKQWVALECILVEAEPLILSETKMSTLAKLRATLLSIASFCSLKVTFDP